MIIVNLTQHPASAEQLAVGVVDLPSEQRALLVHSLTVDTLPTLSEIVERCETVAALAVNNGLGADEGNDPHPTAAMIGGAPWMMRALEDALLDQGITPVYAFSVRESAEQTQPDGSVRKMAMFRHVGFVQCGAE